MSSERTESEADQGDEVASNAYPFLSKGQVKARILEDRDFAIECVATVQARHERRLAGEASDGPSGWMSSQSSVGPKLASKIADGSATEEEIARAVEMVAKYSKQIALELRAAELQERPELAATAERFGVGPSGAGLLPPAGARRAQAGPAVRPKRPRAEPVAEERAPSAEAGDAPCAVCARVTGLLAVEGGRRSTDLAEALDTTTVDLARHLRGLMQRGAIVKQGHGRGSRYYSPA